VASPEILILLEQNPPLLTAVVFVFGLLVGSFLNVVVYRLPVMLERSWQQEARAILELDDEPTTDRFNLIVPASRCPGCGHLIRWYENIPLISYFLILGGKCSSCKSAISLRYPLIELATALISGFIVWQLGFNLAAFAVIFFSWCLIALTAIDIDYQLLPDKITLPLLWIGLILNSFDYFTSLPSALWGAVLGYLSLWSVYWLFKLLTGKEGMGYGDFKLLAALGAWAGADMLPLIILVSSLIGAIVGGLMIAFSRHESQTPIPFGPYLAGAGWVALLWGDGLTGWYLQLLNL